MTIASGERMFASDILNLTFFPKGTILTFSSAAWGATSAEFKNVWKICNAANHQADPNNVPDLTNRFLRGGTSSDFTTGGGADSQKVSLQTANLPSHSHGATGLSLGSLNTSGLTISQSGAHGHSGSGTAENESPVHTHTVNDPGHVHTYQDTGGGAMGAIYQNYHGHGVGRYTTDDTSQSPTNITVTGGTHSHKVSVTIPESGSHSHTVSGGISGSTASAGSGNPFTIDTVPSYYTVIYIIRVA